MQFSVLSERPRPRRRRPPRFRGWRPQRASSFFLAAAEAPTGEYRREGSPQHERANDHARLYGAALSRANRDRLAPPIRPRALGCRRPCHDPHRVRLPAPPNPPCGSSPFPAAGTAQLVEQRDWKSGSLFIPTLGHDRTVEHRGIPRRIQLNLAGPSDGPVSPCLPHASQRFFARGRVPGRGAKLVFRRGTWRSPASHSLGPTLRDQNRTIAPVARCGPSGFAITFAERLPGRLPSSRTFRRRFVERHALARRPRRPHGRARPFRPGAPPPVRDRDSSHIRGRSTWPHPSQ